MAQATPSYTSNPYLELTAEEMKILLGQSLSLYPGKHYRTLNLTIKPGNNLVSMPLTFAGSGDSLSTIIPPATYPAITEVKEATTASTVVNGAWVGSLTTIAGKKGYWIYNNSSQDVTLSVKGSPFYGDELKETWSDGNNIISYPLDKNYTSIETSIAYALTSDKIDQFRGNSVAAQWIPGDDKFVGSLEKLQKGDGYWVKTLTGHAVSDTAFWKENTPNVMTGHPVEDNANFKTDQTYQQCFYYIHLGAFDIDGVELIPGEDWISTFRGDICCGTTIYRGRATVNYTSGFTPTYVGSGDMIYTGIATSYTIGSAAQPYRNFAKYKVGDIPTFIIWDHSKQKYYNAILKDNSNATVTMASFKVAAQTIHGHDQQWKLVATSELT